MPITNKGSKSAGSGAGGVGSSGGKTTSSSSKTGSSKFLSTSGGSSSGSSSSKSKSSGLRFIWIPGRKRHHHKGNVETTGKEPQQPRVHHGQQQQWSLGGTKEQGKLADGAEGKS